MSAGPRGAGGRRGCCPEAGLPVSDGAGIGGKPGPGAAPPGIGSVPVGAEGPAVGVRVRAQRLPGRGRPVGRAVLGSRLCRNREPLWSRDPRAAALDSGPRSPRAERLTDFPRVLSAGDGPRAPLRGAGSGPRGAGNRTGQHPRTSGNARPQQDKVVPAEAMDSK